MPSITTYPISIVLSSAVIMGIFMHGTQIDSAASISMSIPAIIAEYKKGTVDLSKSDQHPQAEISSFSESTHAVGSQPSTQPNKDNDKKYIMQKRILGDGIDSDFV